MPCPQGLDPTGKDATCSRANTIIIIIIIIIVTHQSHQEPDGRLNTHPSVHGAKTPIGALMSLSPLWKEQLNPRHEEGETGIKSKALVSLE